MSHAGRTHTHGVDLSHGQLRHAAARFVHIGVHPCFVGAWHLPLATLLNALPAAGLHLLHTCESGPAPAAVPDLFAIAAARPG